ncbi:MAG: glycosyltransferase [Bdellovibrionales bacterium]|nr:glycosyltransferase [Bdellovibrionales bacterium]
MNSRKFRLISQNLVLHDAVSTHILELQTFLQKAGHIASCCAMGIADQYKATTLPIQQLSQTIAPDEIVFYQYSIWDPNLELILKLPNKKVVYYHGITTPSLLHELMPVTADDCQKGLDALPRLKAFDVVVANSNFNLDQIKEQFQPKISAVLPPYLFNKKYSQKNQSASHDAYQLIYVGRFFPHKNIEKTIKVYQELKKIDPKYRIILAGTGILPDYVTRLRNLANNDPAIEFRFDLSNDSLLSLYASSGALLNFSKHEGFGVPFIEAFQLDLPVVSHSYAAIPETLHAAGILIEDNFSVRDIQKLHDELQNNHESIVIKQRSIFDQFYSDSVVYKQYSKFFDQVTSL